MQPLRHQHQCAQSQLSAGTRPPAGRQVAAWMVKLHACVRQHRSLHTRTHMRMCVSACAYVCACVRVCLCVCLCARVRAFACRWTCKQMDLVYPVLASRVRSHAGAVSSLAGKEQATSTHRHIAAGRALTFAAKSWMACASLKWPSTCLATQDAGASGEGSRHFMRTPKFACAHTQQVAEA